MVSNEVVVCCGRFILRKIGITHFGWDVIFEVLGWVWIQEKKPTANRHESALRANRIGFALPHSRKSLARQSLARLRPPLRVSPPSTCSSLHRERSGKSCRRPSGSCGRKRFFYYISGCGAATVGRPFRGGLSRASPGGKRKGLATPALRRIDGAAGDLSRASR